MTGRRLAALAACALALAGCGGDASPGAKALAETADTLGEIRSGDLTLRLLARASAESAEQVGFEVEGPFALADEERPAAIDVVYTRHRGTESTEVGLRAANGKAFVGTNGTWYVLPADQAAPLVAAGDSKDDDPLDGLDLESWLAEARLERAGDLDRVTGRVDAVAVVNDLIDLARDAGRTDLERIEGDDADRLRAAVRDASLVLRTGAEDRQFRDVVLELELGADVPESLRRSFGDAVGALVRFELGIERPNTRIEVAEPESPRPYEELSSG